MQIHMGEWMDRQTYGVLLSVLLPSNFKREKIFLKKSVFHSTL